MKNMENGRFRGNPEASLTNSTRFNKCDDSAVCVDTLETGTTLTNEAVTLFVYEGVDYVVDLTVDDTDGIVAAILEIIAPFEIDPIVTADLTTGTLTVTHTGAGTLSSATVDGSAVALTRNCD
jgi:hypothetical protein